MPALSDRLVESVPNVSEGRRLDTVERLADAIAGVPEVQLLDRTSDASHNRSVFTLAGPAGAVSSALDRLVGAAINEIDMEPHSGEHPRIGAVDVIPFVPLGDTSMEEAVDIARDFGARLARTATTCPSTSTPKPPSEASGSSSPTSGGASTRGSRRRSRSAGASLTSGRPGCTHRPARSRWVRGSS